SLLMAELGESMQTLKRIVSVAATRVTVSRSVSTMPSGSMNANMEGRIIHNKCVTRFVTQDIAAIFLTCTARSREN
ncbi:hypothetical protein, partial [Streptococcus pneumoniae]|uniref:hypothetical protein n=1 Tax=Streptococcus pneumoniae TaxID=1313 RepID=UPI001E2F2F96